MRKLKTVTADDLIEIVTRMVADEGITQAALAQKIGISPGNLADMLAGRRSPWPVAKYLGFTLKTFSKEIKK